jgi:hypothetical protein
MKFLPTEQIQLNENNFWKFLISSMHHFDCYSKLESVMELYLWRHFFLVFHVTVIFSLWLPEVLQKARIVTRFFYSQDMIFILRKPEFLLEVF